MTVDLVWEYVPPINFFTNAWGDADYNEEADTVIVTFSGIMFSDNGEPLDRRRIRIVEVTHDDKKDVVFDLAIGTGDPTDPIGWRAYRSERLPLYPPGVATYTEN